MKGNFFSDLKEEQDFLGSKWKKPSAFYCFVIIFLYEISLVLVRTTIFEDFSVLPEVLSV